MAGVCNSVTPGMGEIIQLNVGGTRWVLHISRVSLRRLLAWSLRMEVLDHTMDIAVGLDNVGFWTDRESDCCCRVSGLHPVYRFLVPFREDIPFVANVPFLNCIQWWYLKKFIASKANSVNWEGIIFFCCTWFCYWLNVRFLTDPSQSSRV